MASYNKFIGMGNLTRDPELRFTPKGTAVCEFGVAINSSWTDERGERMEKVVFLDVTAWGRRGEVISEHFEKGKPIFFEGRVEMDQWDDKQTGQKRTKLKVVLEEFQFIGAPPEQDRDRGSSSRSQQREPARRSEPRSMPARPPHDPDLDVSEEEIPF